MMIRTKKNAKRVSQKNQWCRSLDAVIPSPNLCLYSRIFPVLSRQIKRKRPEADEPLPHGHRENRLILTKNPGERITKDRNLATSNTAILHCFALIMLFAFTCCIPLVHASPPPVNDVFSFNLHVQDPNRFSVNWHIKPGYFLYASSIKIQPIQPQLLKTGVAQYPKPIKKTNRLGQIDKLYQGELVFEIPVLAKKPGEYPLHLHYQGCAKNGFCYPPQDKLIQLSFNKHSELFKAEILNNESSTPSLKDMDTHHQILKNRSIEMVFQNQNPLIILLIFAGFGLLLSFTPCVLPMIPVLSGLIIRHGHDISTRKAFFLSLSYVMGMSFTYALIGAIAATLGANLQVIMQLPVVIITMSLIFAMLAFSMFGLYEVTLPIAWQTKFAQLTRNRANGHYWNAVLMGCLSTLVLSPCVTPPLVGAIGYIIQTGNIIMGAFALFALGLGMGIPLLLIGMSSGKWLPKVGHWMNTVKAFFGVLLLSVSLYLLSRIVSAHLMMILWSILFVLSGIFAGALEPVQHPVERLFKGIGILALGYGLLMLTGFALDNTDPLHPLKKDSQPDSVSIESAAIRVHTLEGLDQALKHAKGHPVVLDFYADWCTSCKIMAATTLQDPTIVKALEKFKIIIVDLSENSQASKALMNRFQVIAPPAFIFLNQNGEEFTNTRLIGDISSQVFYGQISNIPLE